MNKTLRQIIAEILSQDVLSSLELSSRLGIKEKEITYHLGHIRSSIKPKKLILVEPAFCKDCGFKFKKRDRLNPPSRCPQCKGEYIERPRFSIP
ncbi:MAG TPA: transcriptional regulator [Candidatus Atribacteria bacterium]|nr:transcriptional regulator [Candidatus Atribacteria bacterium]